MARSTRSITPILLPVAFASAFAVATALAGCEDAESESDDASSKVCELTVDRGPGARSCLGRYVSCDDVVFDYRCEAVDGNPDNGFTCTCSENGRESRTFESEDVCVLGFQNNWLGYDVRVREGCGWTALDAADLPDPFDED